MVQRIEFDGKIQEFPDDFTDVDIQKALQPKPQTVMDQAKAVAKEIIPTAVDVGKRTLDFISGGVRTAAHIPSSLVQQAQGGPAIVKGEDYIKALSGDAPSWSQYQDRIEGNPLAGTLTGKALGFAGDIASDISGTGILTKAIPAAKAVITALNKPFQAMTDALGSKKGWQGIVGGGKYFYKNTFRNEDRVAKAINAIPTSEIAMKYGIKGSAKDMEEKLMGILASHNTERKAIMSNYSDTSTDVTKAVEDGLKFLKEKQKYKGPTADVAKGIEKEFTGIINNAMGNGYLRRNPATGAYEGSFDYANYLKKELRTLAENESSMFKKFHTHDITDTFVKKISGEVNNSTINAIKAKGTADDFKNALRFREIAKEEQSLIETARTLYNSSQKMAEARFGAVDALGLAESLPFFATRQAVNISRMPIVQTNIGNALLKAAGSEVTPYVFKRAAINAADMGDK